MSISQEMYWVRKNLGVFGCGCLSRHLDHLLVGYFLALAQPSLALFCLLLLGVQSPLEQSSPDGYLQFLAVPAQGSEVT